MQSPPLASAHSAELDPVILFEQELRQDMTLIRLVLCAALAVAILAIASRLLA